MKDFNLKKWMFENKVTKQSALITEIEVDFGDPKDTRPEFDAGSDDPAEVISFHASRLEDALDPDDVSGTVGQFPSTRIQQKIKAQAAKLKGRRVKLTDDQMDDLRSYAKGLMGEENRDLADVAKKMSDENNVDVSGLDQKRMELLGSYILKDLYDMDFEKAMRDNNLPFD